jgi:hypothetical protein
MAKRKLPAKTIRTRAPRGTINGKPIVDAKAPMVVSITKPDIKGAKTGSPENCGAARAIKRQEGLEHVYVHHGSTYVEREDKVERFMTGSRLRGETIGWDRGGSPKYLEGDYRLLPPSESKRLGVDHRPSIRGGGADKRGAGPVYPRYEVAGARPKGTSHHNT